MLVIILVLAMGVGYVYSSSDDPERCTFQTTGWINCDPLNPWYSWSIDCNFCSVTLKYYCFRVPLKIQIKEYIMYTLMLGQMFKISKFHSLFIKIFYPVKLYNYDYF